MDKINLEMGGEIQQATPASMVVAILFSSNIVHGNYDFKYVLHFF